MKEPHRLLKQGATEAERAILGSASADGPPDGAVQRMMIALDGMAAGNAGPSPQGPGHGLGSSLPKARLGTQSFKLATVAKVGLLTLAGVAGLGVGVSVYRLAGPRDVEIETSAATAPATKAAVAPDSPHVPGAPQGAPATAKPAASTPSEMAGAPSHRQTGPLDDSLSAELRILDRARAALDARNPGEARRALDSHAQRFPQGHLKPEAAVLRLAVLVRQGDGVAAKSLAQALLANESYKTYEPRIRSLLREIAE
jgi:hypothetical protein